jgi:hypothetical protein
MPIVGLPVGPLFVSWPDGNPAPGGITLEDISVKVAGPHAGFEMTEEEWCELQNDMIG